MSRWVQEMGKLINESQLKTAFLKEGKRMHVKTPTLPQIFDLEFLQINT